MAEHPTIAVSIEIEAPIWRVYQNWKRLERFPSFVRSIKEARWLSETRLYWREEHEGKTYESTFEVAMDLNRNGLSWQSLSGPKSSGDARCEPLPSGRTRVALTIRYAPDEESQSASAVRSRHQAYLRAFKRFVESRASSRSGEQNAPLAIRSEL